VDVNGYFLPRPFPLPAPRLLPRPPRGQLPVFLFLRIPPDCPLPFPDPSRLGVPVRFAIAFTLSIKLLEPSRELFSMPYLNLRSMRGSNCGRVRM